MGNRDMTMSRRTFLQTVGLVAGGVVTMPLQAHAAKILSRSLDLTVGVLSPRSTVVPLMGDRFVTGMKLRFAEAEWTGVNLITVDAGLSPGRTLAGAEELLTAHHVDVLVGFVAPSSQSRLLEFLKRRNTPFINVEGGANLPSEAGEHPLINYNSWGCWQSNRAMGSWAAANMGKRAFIASSRYESGYDASHAFRDGFESAGGRIDRDSVIHIADDRGELEALMAAIKAAKADLVYAMYSGRGAVDFVTAYEQAGLSGVVPLAASPFMVDETLLPAMGSAALGIRSCLSWAPGLDNQGNNAFRRACGRATGSAPDLFAMLGYETAAMITATSGGKELAQELRRVKFSGPRGDYVMNSQSGRADIPLYLREVRSAGTGLENVVLEQLPHPAVRHQVPDRFATVVRSGWSNAYLCV